MSPLKWARALRIMFLLWLFSWYLRRHSGSIRTLYNANHTCRASCLATNGSVSRLGLNFAELESLVSWHRHPLALLKHTVLPCEH